MIDAPNGNERRVPSRVRNFVFLKVWWLAVTLFIYFYINRADIQSLYILLVDPLVRNLFYPYKSRFESQESQKYFNPNKLSLDGQFKNSKLILPYKSRFEGQVKSLKNILTPINRVLM